MLNWLVYAALGKLFIYLWQLFPLPEMKKTYISQVIYKLHLCDLCSGTWIFSVLALAFKVDIFQDAFGYTAPIALILGELATGAITSFAVHIFSLGIREKYFNEVLVI